MQRMELPICRVRKVSHGVSTFFVEMSTTRFFRLLAIFLPERFRRFHVRYTPVRRQSQVVFVQRSSHTGTFGRLPFLPFTSKQQGLADTVIFVTDGLTSGHYIFKADIRIEYIYMSP